MKKYDIAIVGSAGVPSSYGGFETLVDFLCRTSVVKKPRLLVFCSTKQTKVILSKKYFGCDLEYLSLSANGAQSIIYDVVSMIRSIGKARCLLVLGVSGCIFLPFLKLFFEKVVVNIDGLEWKRAKWGGLQKFFLRVSEYIAIRTATIVIGDNQEIVEHIHRIYPKANSELIAYGGDHVHAPSDVKKLPHTILSLSGDYWVSVCRIEPENNVQMILEAFSIAKKNLVFVGNWERSDYGKMLKKKYECISNIRLLDPIYDLDILDEIRGRATGYVHGHSAGGTNPSLVEAMFFAIPIICFDVSYNRSTTNNLAMYFSNVDALVGCLVDNIDDNLKKNVEMLKVHAQNNYTWSKVVYSYWDAFNLK